MSIEADTAEFFTPKEPVEITVGRYSASVYPKLEANAPDYETAYAFHLTSAALRLLNISPALYLDTLGSRLNVSTTVDGHKFDWTNHLDENWCNFDHLEILSFHNTAGTVLATACLADSTVLKPVGDNLTNPNRRPADVRFVRVKLTLDFRPLMLADQPNHVLEASYYIELPQDTVEVLDHAGNPFPLTTFHGPADLSVLSAEEVRALILSRVSHADPIDLKDPAFNVTAAAIESDEIRADLEKRVLKLAIPTIEKHVFDVICPDYSHKPHAVVENIKQWTKDADGNVKVASRDYEAGVHCERRALLR
jgi:hypothetical protein